MTRWHVVVRIPQSVTPCFCGTADRHSRDVYVTAPDSEQAIIEAETEVAREHGPGVIAVSAMNLPVFPRT